MVIGIGAGAKGEINLRDLMPKRATLRASTLRARPLEEKALTARAMERHVAPAVRERRAARAGRRDVPARRRSQAYDRFAEGGKVGKIVLLAGDG